MSIPEINGIFAEHYLLKEQLGPGMVEQVWKAEDWSAAGTPVTIRLYAPHIRLDKHSLELLQRELELRASLRHPHLLAPTSIGVHGGIPFDVIPLEPSQTLAQRLLLNGPLPEREIALLISQLGNSLQYLHTQRPPLPHRQINPDSILQDASGNYSLAAPALSSQIRTLLHRASGIPATQYTAYAAPELFGQHPLHTSASDVFAFGVSLYELCTGETPWLGNGGLSLSQGAEIPVVSAPYSRILSNLIRACLHPDPDKRPSAQTLMDEAAYYLEQGAWKPYGAFGDVTAESIVYKERPRWLWPVLLLLLVAGALAAAYYFIDWKTPDSTEEVATETGVLPEGPEKMSTTDTTLVEPASKSVTSDTIAKAKSSETLAKPMTEPGKEKAVAVTKPAPSPPAQPAYPRPTSLGGYFNGLLNDEIPLQVRERWRPAIRAYFTPDAIIYARMNGTALGNFGVSEFIDILLSIEDGNSLIIDETIQNEESAAIEEINVSIITVK